MLFLKLRYIIFCSLNLKSLGLPQKCLDRGGTLLALDHGLQAQIEIPLLEHMWVLDCAASTHGEVQCMLGRLRAESLSPYISLASQ